MAFPGQGLSVRRLRIRRCAPLGLTLLCALLAWSGPATAAGTEPQTTRADSVGARRDAAGNARKRLPDTGESEAEADSATQRASSGTQADVPAVRYAAGFGGEEARYDSLTDETDSHSGRRLHEEDARYDTQADGKEAHLETQVDEEETDLGTVEVEGRRPPPARRTGVPESSEPTGFGTVLRAEDYAGERFEAADLLLRVPGTVVRRTPAGSTLSLRGSSSDQTLVFVDGIRLSPASGGGLDLRTIPSGLIDTLTLLRGNEGALYGAGALGGVASITTLPPREGLGTSLSLLGGSFGSFGLDAAVTGGSRRAHGVAALSLSHFDGGYPALYDPTPTGRSEPPRTERMANNDQSQGAMLLKGSLGMGELRLHALTQAMVGERGLPGTLYHRDTQRKREERLLVGLRAEADRPGDFDVSGNLHYRRDAIAVWGSKIPSTISQPLVPGVERPQQIEQAIEGEVATEWAASRWTLLRAVAAAGREWLDSPYHGDPERRRLALGIADELYLGDVLTLAPALRYERIGSHEGLSPKLGVSLRALPWLELRANVGRSFRAPSLGELYLEAGPVRANPDLRPETGTSVDGGLLLRWEALQLQASAFYSRMNDLISYEVVSGGVSKPFNFMDAEVAGGELEAVARPFHWLTLSAGYGVARTRNLREDVRFHGKELPYRPAQRFTGRAALHDEDWEGFVEASHQSEQYVNRANTDSLPAQTWLRLGGGRRLLRAPWEMWLSAQMDNALDAKLVDELGFPQPGRAFFVTLRAAWET